MWHHGDRARKSRTRRVVPAGLTGPNRPLFQYSYTYTNGVLNPGSDGNHGGTLFGPEESDRMGPEQRLLEQRTRRRIFQHVQRKPGEHLRGIHKETGVPLSTLEYHLRQLERGGLVRTMVSGNQKVFFDRDFEDRADQRILHHLRRPTTGPILRILVDEPEIHVQELEKRLPVGAATVSYHLKRLSREGLVDPFWMDGRKYYLVRDDDRVRRLMEEYNLQGAPEERAQNEEPPGRQDAPIRPEFRQST